MKRPLSGCRILVTRPKAQAVPLMREINSRGGEAVLFPVISIEDPESWDECDRAIRGIARYDGIVFTSANAVDRFAQRLRQHRGSPLAIPCHAVGAATRDRIREEGLTVPSRMPDDATAEGLLDLLRSEPVGGKRFLLPQGDRSRDVLRRGLEESGALVEAVVFYRTVDAKPGDALAVRDEIESGMIDVVTFASPSAVRGFFRLTESKSLFLGAGAPWIAVIGATTGQAVQDDGLPVTVKAPRPEIRALVDAIESYYRNSTR